MTRGEHHHYYKPKNYQTDRAEGMAVALDIPAHLINAEQMHATAHNCPNCGTSVPLERSSQDAHRQIRELQEQVEMLKEKATAAVDRCADYEDQLRNIKNLPRSNTTESLDPHTSRPSADDARPSTANSTSARLSRFSFLTGRRDPPAQAQLSALQLPPSDTELHEQLEKERSLRAKAEDRARKVDIEIEELSVQLFSQANEMVATERKARAKLEARVEILEKKDKDKMARLERLENAVSRIDRVKAMLATPTGAIVRKKT